MPKRGAGRKGGGERKRGDGKKDGAKRTAPVLALLSGDEELDRPTREALSSLSVPWREAEGPADVLTAGGGAASLVVLDAAAPDAHPPDVIASLAGTSPPPPPVIVLLPEPRPPEEAYGAEAGIRHWLCRPFQPETLAAVCRALAAPVLPGEGRLAEPSVRVRGPARFSARPLYAEATAFVREAFDRARAGERPVIDPARLLSEKIHTSLLQSNLLLLRALEPYKRFELPEHCVNVAIIAGKISMGLDHPLAETHRVIQAGMLHDIGMTRVPERILLKEGPLTDREREEVERHPLYGAEILGKLGKQAESLARVVRQEHERVQGQGYPEGLEGDAIDPVARVIGVADVFEAFSQVRAHRSPFTLYEALEKVTSMRDEYFDRGIVDALAREISVFPLDSYVQLNTGEIGRVVATDAANLMRPTVEVLWNEQWTPLPEPRRVDLGEAPDISIVRPLHEAEVPIT